MIKMKTVLSLFKGLNHSHLVQLIGSYSLPESINLLMTPVADEDLSTFLSSVPHNPENKTLVRSFFGCLASALNYLHEGGVCHKNVKPSNILISNKTVL
jgi:serine/threonine protein kinase